MKTATTTFKFSELLISDGTHISDGHFLAQIKLPGIKWKCPTEEATARLFNRERFTCRNKKIADNCPDFADILSMEKVSNIKLEDTRVSLEYWVTPGDLINIRLLFSEALPYPHIVGVNNLYMPILDPLEMFTQNSSSPVFSPYRGCVMPIYKPLDGYDMQRYFPKMPEA